MTNTTFTDDYMSVRFGLLPAGKLGARYRTGVTDSSTGITDYYLVLYGYTYMEVVAPEKAYINAIYFPNTISQHQGGIYTNDGIFYNSDGVNAFSWKPNSDEELDVVRFETDGYESDIQKMVVEYTLEAERLKATTDIADNGTIESFKELNIAFDKNVEVVSGKVCTISNDTETDTLTITPSETDRSTITLSLNEPLTTDGTYTITIPAGTVKSTEGFYNPELTYTVHVKSSLQVVSINPEPGNVEEIPTEITLSFEKGIQLTGSDTIYIYKNGEEHDLYKATVSEGRTELILSEGIGYLDDGKYEIIIPQNFVSDRIGTKFNNTITLTYTIGATGEGDNNEGGDGNEGGGDDNEGEDTHPEVSAVMQNAIDLVEKIGQVGYPQEDSQAAVALKAITTPSEEEGAATPTDEDIQSAIDAFYAETNVALPEAGKLYRIIGVNHPSAEEATPSKLYLSYDDSKVSITDNSLKAAEFEAQRNEDGTVSFKTSDNKYLHVLTTNDNFDLTTTDNVCDYNATVNNLTLGRLILEGVDNKATFGLFSIYGTLGKEGEGTEDQSAYIRLRYDRKAIVTTPGSEIVFSEISSDAFIIEEVKEEVPEIVPLAGSLSPTEVTSNTQKLTFSFTTEASTIHLNPKAVPYITDRRGNTIIATNDTTIIVQEVGATNSFEVSLAGLENGYYTLVLPDQTFYYEEDGKVVYIQGESKDFAITSQFRTNSWPIEKVPEGMRKYISDTDFNNFTIYIETENLNGELGVDTTKEIKIVDFTWTSIVVATGHFVPYEDNDPERVDTKAMRLVLDQPFSEENPIRAYGTYAMLFPEATYGDANFAQWLRDNTSIEKSSCTVNKEDYEIFHVNNNYAGYDYPYNGTIDGIWRPLVDEEGNQVIYDITGKRINEVKSSGFYIINGKKVLIRK